MPSIFISYRRQDVSGHAGRLAAELSSRYGRENVFIDIDAISPGVDFEERIHRALDACQVTIVLIGDEWLAAARGGRRRIEEENDYVRMEVAAALARDDVTVIPVLVEGAQMPSASELPADISRLTKINACELSTRRWRYDFDRLDEVVGRSDSRWGRLVRATPKWAKRASPFLALGAAAAVAVILLAGGSSDNVKPPRGPEGNLAFSSVGPVRVGESPDRVRAQFGPPDRAQRSGVPDCYTATRWIWDLRNGSFSMDFDPSKRKLTSYSTTSPNLPTTTGNRVNDSFQSIRDTWAASLRPLNLGLASTPRSGYWYVKDVGKHAAARITSYPPKIVYSIAGGKVRSIAGGEVPICE
jgi:TIR domain-containing protein